MLFMVIERIKDNDMVPIYRHLRDSGRSFQRVCATLTVGFKLTVVGAFS